MASSKEILVPDIGSASDVNVIEILVKPGDKIAKEQSLVTLESEKASMEIPAPFAGVIADIKVKIGDKVSEGSLLMTVTIDEAVATTQQATTPAATEEKPKITEEAKSTPAASAATTSAPELKEVRVPDIGSATDVNVIEVLIKAGDKVEKEQSLVTLESEKASMEIPSPYNGEVREVKIKVGDKVSQNDLILTMMAQAGATTEKAATASATTPSTVEKSGEVAQPKTPPTMPAPTAIKSFAQVHAGPSVRQFARELGVDLTAVKGSGPKGRILKEDVTAYVKAELQKPKGATGGLNIAPAPAIDFSKFGDIEVKPLNKIKRFTAINVHRSWVTVPHVTQFDEADITDLEEFRKSEKAVTEAQGVKLTPLVFIMKSVVSTLKEFPLFNASLDPSGENLIYKKYFNLGIAVDTPNGLVVPVIRNVDCKGFLDLAKELAEISKKAREKGLTPAEMSGSCFTISSLGGIGGTAFTPIVNTPDVAILGVSKATIKPVYQNGQFIPRLMLPLSLSYDHRVIDGADGARFIVSLAKKLADIKTLLL